MATHKVWSGGCVLLYRYGIHIPFVLRSFVQVEFALVLLERCVIVICWNVSTIHVGILTCFYSVDVLTPDVLAVDTLKCWTRLFPTIYELYSGPRANLSIDVTDLSFFAIASPVDSDINIIGKAEEEHGSNPVKG